MITRNLKSRLKIMLTIATISSFVIGFKTVEAGLFRKKTSTTNPAILTAQILKETDLEVDLINAKSPTNFEHKNYYSSYFGNNDTRFQIEGFSPNMSFNTHFKKLLDTKGIKGSPIIVHFPSSGQSVDIMYILNKKNELIAFDIQNKSVLWKNNLNLEGHIYDFGGLDYDPDYRKIYVTTGGRDFVVVDALDGLELTRVKLPGISLSASTNFADRVLILTADNVAITLDKNNGYKIINEMGVEDEILFQNPNAQITLNSLPKLYKNTVDDLHALIPYNNGSLTLLDLRHKKLIWKLDTTENIPFRENIPFFIPLNFLSQPIIRSNENSIYFATRSGYLSKINYETAKPIWTKNFRNMQAMNLLGNATIVVDGTNLIAMDNKQGKIIWVTDLVNSSANVNPKVTKNCAFLVPIHINNAIYIFNDKGQLFEVDPYKGELLKVLKAPKNIKSVNIYNNQLYIFTKDKVLYMNKLDHKVGF